MTVYYRVRAKNGVDLGVASNEVPCLNDAVPNFMNAPTNTSVTYKQIDLSWNPITDSDVIGRDSIIYWSLEWFNRFCYTDSTKLCSINFNAEDGTWTELTDYSSSTRSALSTTYSHKISTRFFANIDFAYRLRAKNGVGYGVYSAETLVLTDNVPDPMAAPSLVIVRNNYVDLKWSEVLDFEASGRDPVLYYSVWWDQGTGNYV